MKEVTLDAFCNRVEPGSPIAYIAGIRWGYMRQEKAFVDPLYEEGTSGKMLVHPFTRPLQTVRLQAGYTSYALYNTVTAEYRFPGSFTISSEQDCLKARQPYEKVVEVTYYPRIVSLVNQETEAERIKREELVDYWTAKRVIRKFVKD